MKHFYLSLFLATKGTVMIVGQFPQVDQFRWIAWFQVVLGVLAVIAALLLFREPLPSFLSCGPKGLLPAAKEVCLEKENQLQKEQSKQSISLGTVLVSIFGLHAYMLYKVYNQFFVM